MGGRRPLPLKGEREWLLARIAAKPDLTPACAGAGSCGRWWPSWPSAAPRPATAAVWRFFAREGFSFKKPARQRAEPAPAQAGDRLDIARRRARCKTHQGRLDPQRLVFLDETWAKTTMTRRYGRWARGARLVAKLPHRRWRTLTFRAARRHDRSAAPCVIDGPINATSFGAGACPCEGGVEQFLVPTLSPGDIVVMDNLGSHKGKAVRPPASRRRRQAVLPAALFTRSQPDRARLGQAQDLAAQNRPAHDRGHLAQHRRPSRPLHPDRMRQ